MRAALLKQMSTVLHTISRLHEPEAVSAYCLFMMTMMLIYGSLVCC